MWQKKKKKQQQLDCSRSPVSLDLYKDLLDISFYGQFVKYSVLFLITY